MNRQTVCVDFDGVLHSYQRRWQGAHVIPDPPVPGAMRWLEAVLLHFDVAIHSSRSKSLRGRRAMKCWLLCQLAQNIDLGQPLYPLARAAKPDDLDFMADESVERARAILRRVHWPWFKPAAVLTIDDRAWRFEGSFPTIQEIRQFQPWNRKPRAV